MVRLGERGRRDKGAPSSIIIVIYALHFAGRSNLAYLRKELKDRKTE